METKSFLQDIRLRWQTLALAVPRAMLPALALCLAAAAISHLPAQSTKAELFGRVTDPTGLPAPEAVLELEHAGTAIKHDAVTGAEGSYYFSALPAGVYRLTASKLGFRMLRREGIDLRVGDRVALDLMLERVCL